MAANIPLIEGNPYECGFQVGNLFKNEIKNRLERNGIDDVAVLQYKEALEKTNDFHRNQYEFCLDEIRGMAEGSGQDYWKLFLLNCPHLKKREQGCTSIAVRRTRGGIVLGHNEDGANGDMPEECALIEFVQPNNHFFSFVYAGELPGCAYGWNGHHLYVTVNYVPPAESSYDILVSRHVVARALLNAETVEEAISIIKRPKHADGFHYFIGQKDALYSVEMMEEKVSIYPVEAMMIHTNHHVHKEFLNLIPEGEKSKMRYEKAAELLNKGKNVDEVLFDKGKAPLCIYCSNDTTRTLSTAFFYPREGQVLVCPKNTLEGALRSDL